MVAGPEIQYRDLCSRDYLRITKSSVIDSQGYVQTLTAHKVVAQGRYTVEFRNNTHTVDGGWNQSYNNTSDKVTRNLKQNRVHVTIFIKSVSRKAASG